MTPTPADPTSDDQTADATTTRDELHRIAVHVVARARHQATGRFGLRVSPGGFATPAFGDDVRRVRVSGDLLIVERAGPDGASTDVATITGAGLATLAAVAGVDLDAPLDVGHDTPAVGDVDRPIVVDPGAARALSGWLGVVTEALDRTMGSLGGAAAPSAVQLWPEHFDVAFDAAVAAGVRANFGGSPGDGGHAGPYAYVGPWTADRPGADDGFWNAPFGALLAARDVLRDVDPVGRLVEFFVAGARRFAD